jgi:hypothetical protein
MNKVHLIKELFTIDPALLAPINPSNLKDYIKQYNESLIELIQEYKKKIEGVGLHEDASWAVGKSFYLFNSLYAYWNNLPLFYQDDSHRLWGRLNVEPDLAAVKNLIVKNLFINSVEKDGNTTQLADWLMIGAYFKINLGVLFELFMAGVPTGFKNGVDFRRCYE